MKKSESVTVNYSTEWKVNPYPGYLIVIDSLDGSGKGVQQENLVRGLREKGARVALTSEPTNGPFGSSIRLALTHRLVIDDLATQMGFSADRADDLFKNGGTIDNLRSGLIEIKDRYFWSTLAYGYALGLDMEWLMLLQVKFPIPDASFYIKVPPEVCLERIEKSRRSRELFETIDRLKKTEEGYKILCERFRDHITTLDGQVNPEEVTTAIFAKLGENRKFRDVLESQKHI